MESSAFKEAFEEIRKLSMDPDTVQLAISREIALLDHIQRLEDAENRGDKSARIEMILRLHAKSTPLSFIAEVTGFSIEEIKAIVEPQEK